METNEVTGADLKVLNRDIIKYIAMLTMLLNHIAHMFLTPGPVLYEVFEDVGFFTAPVMCFFLVEGYSYTRSKIKYGQRLLVFAIVSQMPYKLALHFGNLNMIYTLLCCFLILVAMENIKDWRLQAAVCTVLTLASAVGDWSILAAIYTMLLYSSRGSRKKTAISYGIAYALFVPFQIQNYMHDITDDWTMDAVVHGLISGAGILAAAIMVLVFYNGRRAGKGRNFSKWFFYIFYPAHLAVLYFIKVYIM